MEDSRFTNRPVNPLDERKQSGSKKSFLGSLYGRIALILYNGTTDKAALSESDGKLTASLYGKAGSTSTAISVETTGEQKISNYGKASGTLTAFGVEATTGEQRIVNCGKDEASNIDVFRTDPNRIPWIRRRREIVQLDSVGVPSTDGILLDGSASLAANGVYEITFEVVNTDGTAAVSVDVYVDIAAGGTASAAEYVLQDVTIPAGGSSGEQRLTMAADDDIRGIAGAADDAAIRFIRVERMDIGA